MSALGQGIEHRPNPSRDAEREYRDAGSSHAPGRGNELLLRSGRRRRITDGCGYNTRPLLPRHIRRFAGRGRQHSESVEPFSTRLLPGQLRLLRLPFLILEPRDAQQRRPQRQDDQQRAVPLANLCLEGAPVDDALADVVKMYRFISRGFGGDEAVLEIGDYGFSSLFLCSFRLSLLARSRAA